MHLSNALEIDLTKSSDIEQIKQFDEPTYLHQVMIKNEPGAILRFKDIDEALNHKSQITNHKSYVARIHFHIPLHAQPKSPFSSTIQHTINTLHYLQQNPDTCNHLEMETYTWGVLPDELQAPIEDQLTQEHVWVLGVLQNS